MIKRSAAFLILATIAILALYNFGPDGVYEFDGHGRTLSTIQKSTVILLALTHTFLAAIMWASRKRWLPSEASMFRFIGVKAIFWTFLAWTMPIRDRGVDIVWLALIILMSLVTIDLDYKLFTRYVMGSEDRRRGTLYRRAKASEEAT